MKVNSLQRGHELEVCEEDCTPCVKGKLPQTTIVKMKTRPTAWASLRESEQLSMHEGEPTTMRDEQTKERMSGGRMNHFFCPTRVKRRGYWWRGHVGKDGQSCHTHHHPAITAPTNQNKTLKRLDETREYGNQQGGNTWVSHP